MEEWREPEVDIAEAASDWLHFMGVVETDDILNEGDLTEELTGHERRELALRDLQGEHARQLRDKKILETAHTVAAYAEYDDGGNLVRPVLPDDAPYTAGVYRILEVQNGKTASIGCGIRFMTPFIDAEGIPGIAHVDVPVWVQSEAQSLFTRAHAIIISRMIEELKGKAASMLLNPDLASVRFENRA